MDRQIRNLDSFIENLETKMQNKGRNNNNAEYRPQACKYLYFITLAGLCSLCFLNCMLKCSKTSTVTKKVKLLKIKQLLLLQHQLKKNQEQVSYNASVIVSNKLTYFWFLNIFRRWKENKKFIYC